MTLLTLNEICDELALVDDRMAKLETERPAVGTPELVAWTEAYLPVRQRMFRLVKLLGDARRKHVGADRAHYRPIVDQVLAELVAPAKAWRIRDSKFGQLVGRDYSSEVEAKDALRTSPFYKPRRRYSVDGPFDARAVR